MLYDGQSIQCQDLGEGIVELIFNLKQESVNKLDKKTLAELREAVTQLQSNQQLRGVLFSSPKEYFIVGADITEFLSYFDQPDAELSKWLADANKIFTDIEDLPVPTVSAINGYALGGGFEAVLATTYRVLSEDAKVGLPETKLGIFPGFGGTVRLSRLVGADNAIEWIASGKDQKAQAALKAGAVHAVVPRDRLREASLNLLKRAANGDLDWKAQNAKKTDPIELSDLDGMMVFEGSKMFVQGQAGPHYPAPVKAIEVMQKGASKSRDEAIAIEGEGFVQMAKTKVAECLVTLFLGDQYLKKQAKDLKTLAKPVNKTAVLGAGIMGGGIAYQSAYKGTPIIMKDIQSDALDKGMEEATNLLQKLVDRKRIDSKKMASVLTSIAPTLSYEPLKDVNLIVEAVVENPEIKKKVLAETEEALGEDVILTTNTSTISIDFLASGLKHPEKFCGMHFFNPVHRMPLVEVIRGKDTDENTVATVVAYASKMGKTPVVVNDCPGFLVNRVLFPYFNGFTKLVRDGVDYRRIDKVMEKFGWPMGPAYLLDVIGIDTGEHAGQVMAEGFPDRMKMEEKTAIEVLYESKRYGQKNDQGFYTYTLDRKGKQKKQHDPQTDELLKSVITGGSESITDEEIVERMMLPMLFECSRCLEENIVASSTELDMALVYGLGFPPFRGGTLKYADTLGIAKVCELGEKYRYLGKLYEPTQQLKAMSQNNEIYYTR